MCLRVSVCGKLKSFRDAGEEDDPVLGAAVCGHHVVHVKRGELGHGHLVRQLVRHALLTKRKRKRKQKQQNAKTEGGRKKTEIQTQTKIAGENDEETNMLRQKHTVH